MPPDDIPYRGTDAVAELLPSPSRAAETVSLLDRVLASLARLGRLAEPRADCDTDAILTDRDRELANAFACLAALYASLGPASASDPEAAVPRHVARLYESCFVALGAGWVDAAHLRHVADLCHALRDAIVGPSPAARNGIAA